MDQGGSAGLSKWKILAVQHLGQHQGPWAAFPIHWASMIWSVWFQSQWPSVSGKIVLHPVPSQVLSLPSLALTLVILCPRSDPEHRARSQEKKNKLLILHCFWSLNQRTEGSNEPQSPREGGGMVAVSGEKGRNILYSMVYSDGTWETSDCDQGNACKPLSFLTSSHSPFSCCRSWKTHTQME